MYEIPYNRYAAVAYARKWALDRNPKYYDFEKIGGDCTNFASQCIYAGSGIMNFTRITGWYYRNTQDRTATWTGVNYLCEFLINNKGPGPFGHIVNRNQIQPGDIVQLGTGSGTFYHTPVVTETTPKILETAHSFDALDRPLSSYTYGNIRYIHIDGVYHP